MSTDAEARKFHHDNLESALKFFATNHYIDEQVKYLKDGVIHYAPTEEGQSKDPTFWIQSIAKRENTKIVTYVGLARLLSVDGLPVKDNGEILLTACTLSPEGGPIVSLFALHLDGDVLRISSPEELEHVRGKEATYRLLCVRPKGTGPLLPEDYR